MSEEIKDEEIKEEESSDVESKDSGVSIDGNTAKKIVYSLCYIWGILFFLPLILYKDDPRSKIHANEGLLLLILSVIGNVVFGVLSSFFGWLFGMLAGIYSLLLFLLGIVGIVYVVTDKNEVLPLIGSIKLIK